MAKITLPPFIASMHGRISDELVIKTNSRGVSFLSKMPKRSQPRQVSAAEVQARLRFAQAAKRTKQVLNSSELSKHWSAIYQSELQQGLTSISSLRAYLMSHFMRSSVL